MPVSDVYSDTYWTQEFDITEADLERIARRMRENRRAYDLTELAKRIVRGRLQYGPELSPAVLTAWTGDPSVRLWDPAGEWAVGDRVIVAVSFLQEGSTTHEPFVGEITAIKAGTVTVRIDALGESRTYVTYAEDAVQLQRWRKTVEDLVRSRQGAKDVESQVEYVLFNHGERIVSRLLDALQADERFLSLEGHWFLRELLAPLSEAQIESLFREMLQRTEPAPTADLVPLVDPPLPAGDVGLFSLYAALRSQPERFENAGTPTRPLWRAVPPPPPPPERAVAAYYAYDPDTYEILIEPGQRLTQRLAQRLQELGLYEAVVTAADEP